MSKEVYDHLGNKYKSIREMCEKYNISYSAYITRINSGWELERALTYPKRMKFIDGVDHLGNRYANMELMCRAYNTSPVDFIYRITQGWNIRDALTTPLTDAEINKEYKGNIVKDHLGNKFQGISSMCRYYDISELTFITRTNAGWSLKDTLTTPVVNKNKPTHMKECKDHLGNSYKSVVAMCKHYNISTAYYYTGLKLGWTLEEILTGLRRRRKW